MKMKASANDGIKVSAPSLEWNDLPPAVVRIRRRILQAVAARSIDDLQIPIQWNEVPPLFSRGQKQNLDPIAFLKQRSFDGQGLEMLRILGSVLKQPYAARQQGDTKTFIWPFFPVVPEVAPLTYERLAPWRCIRFADLTRRDVPRDALVHRISIGIDGTWHYFWSDA